MKSLLLLTVVGLISAILASCGKQPATDRSIAASITNAQRSFSTRGLVREVAEDKKTLVVRHEEIPGYMPKMTMELNVREPAQLEEISAGDLITFDLVVDAETHYIDRIQRVGRSEEKSSTEHSEEPRLAELKPGDAMPEVKLVDENGQSIQLSDFKGKAVAFTFIFSRCPLPDYCPRMNKHFDHARQLLLDNDSGPTNWQFLSISFDAEFDKPDVLKRYGDSYRGQNDDRWLFTAISAEALQTVGPRLDFRFSREGGSFSHNLRTVVLDREGKVFKQFDNNHWTAEELAKAITDAAQR